MLTGCGHSSLDTPKTMSNSKLHLKNELSYEVGCLHGVSYPYRLHIYSIILSGCGQHAQSDSKQ